MKKALDGPVVAVDSMALVWGVRKQGPPGQLKRAKWLFELIDEERAHVIVPSICLAEYLTPLAEENHRNVIAALNERFMIPPFDMQCASLAASLFNQGKVSRTMSTDSSRKVLRADSMIIAIAKIYGAKLLFSHDKDCRNLALKANLKAEDLPLMGQTLWDT